MLGCQCQMGQGSTSPQDDPGMLQLYQGVQLLPPDMSESNLGFFIKGVQVGMQIRASDTQKWTRLGVILGLSFGILAFLNRMEK